MSTSTSTSSTGPAMILIPFSNSINSPTLSGGENRHFISEKEFAIWSKEHPSIRPVNSSSITPVNGTTTSNVLDNGKGLKNYK